jgi:predicted RNA-binding Zn ribbon-like protein
MDEGDKRRVGEEIEPGGRPKAPGRLELLQRFLNTWNHEFPSEWDRIGTPEKARGWLSAKRLISPRATVSASEAARLRELREAIRVLALANHGTRPATRATTLVGREARTAWLRVDIDGGGATSLRPRSSGVDGAIASLLAIVHEAKLAGEWPRLKGCRQCEYVFFDRSKNRSAAWCAMSICGNRTKNRSYRRRLVTERGAGSRTGAGAGA